MKVEIRKVSNGYIFEKPDGTVFVYQNEKELSERFGAFFEKQNINTRFTVEIVKEIGR